MNQVLSAILVMLVGGALLALQAPTNAMLGRAVGSPVNAAFVSFLVGTAVLIVVTLSLRVKPDVEAVKALPWYAWLGGAYGAFLVAATTFAAPRIGVASALTLAISSQLVVALVLDQFGAFGLARLAVTPAKVAGVVLVAIGVVLVRRG
ncbi:DMT family transporter [Caulobacter sp. 17J65-9]|uniref:DMT family transporter n=1 Tax=Caulobacter sp. 17J65-9 TaxID=2709382 RepID=UPI0013CAA258|nr:DMT family transporter [Caulobacter sp. 17J65-9]